MKSLDLKLKMQTKPHNLQGMVMAAFFMLL